MNQVELLKKICKERNISIHKLEMDCGFSNGYISQLRKGVLPTDRAVKISNYLGVKLDYLFPNDNLLVESVKMTTNEVAREWNTEREKENEELISYFNQLSPEMRKNFLNFAKSTAENFSNNS